MLNPQFEFLANLGDRQLTIARSVEIPLSLLEPNPWNYTEASPRQKESIGESIDVFGQIYELVVRPYGDKYQIIDGEQRLSKLPDPCRCHIIKGITDGECKKLTIALNGDSNRSQEKLGLILQSIIPEFGEDVIIALPYTKSEIDFIINPPQPPSGTHDDYSGESQEGWVVRTIKYPQEASEIIDMAYNSIDQSVGLSKDRAIAWGRVMELLAADFLGG